MVHVLVRHGTRAASGEVVRLCPRLFADKQALTKGFGVPPSDVTGVGLVEMRTVGEYLREEYIDRLQFLPGDFFEAVEGPLTFATKNVTHASIRLLTSMKSLEQGFYPGHDMSTYRNIISGDERGVCRKITCSTGMHGRDISNKAILHFLEDFCGKKLTSPHPDGKLRPAVQYVVDTINFMQTQGLPLPPEITPEIKQLGKQVAVDAIHNASAYLNCSLFPRALQDEVIKAVGDKTTLPKFFVDIASRELFYQLAHDHYYGFKFQISGEPDGLVVPGTSIFWELHVPDDTARKPYVIASYTYPGDKAGMAERRVLRMQDCPEECPVDQFLEIHRRLLDSQTCQQHEDAAQASAEGLMEEGPRLGPHGQGAGPMTIVGMMLMVVSAVGIRGAWGALRRDASTASSGEYLALG